MDEKTHIKSDGTARDRIARFLKEDAQFWIVLGFTIATTIFIMVVEGTTQVR